MKRSEITLRTSTSFWIASATESLLLINRVPFLFADAQTTTQAPPHSLKISSGTFGETKSLAMRTLLQSHRKLQ
jgi:hypothetical protein